MLTNLLVRPRVSHLFVDKSRPGDSNGHDGLSLAALGEGINHWHIESHSSNTRDLVLDVSLLGSVASIEPCVLYASRLLEQMPLVTWSRC